MYLDAAYPRRFTICGIRMEPYSLGHKLLLGSVGSPFETNQRAGIADLAVALQICSRSYQQALHFIQSDSMRCMIERWLALFVSENSECDWAEKFGLFREYIQAHSEQPVYSVDESKVGDPSGCPITQLVKVMLMREMHFSEAEILNRPWGLCLWDYTTLRELDGVVRIVDKEAEEKLLKQAHGSANS